MKIKDNVIFIYNIYIYKYLYIYKPRINILIYKINIFYFIE